MEKLPKFKPYEVHEDKDEMIFTPRQLPLPGREIHFDRALPQWWLDKLQERNLV